MKLTTRRAALLALIFNLFGCNFAKQPSDDDNPSQGIREEDEAGPSPQEARATNLFVDAAPLGKSLRDRFGANVRLTEIVVYPTRANVELQIPDDPLNLDAYDYVDGHLGAPTPVQIFGRKPTLESMKQNTFALSELDFTKVPAIIADAPRQVKGEVTHLIVKRGVPFHDEVRWRVYLDSPRRGGSVEYDPTGRMVKVYD